MQVEAAPLSPSGSAPLRLALASAAIDSTDVFLYHKTTRRGVYQAARAARPEADDVILWNERGELTETCVANLALQIGGEWLTPPVASGLLAGTYRAQLLEEGRLRESVLTREQLGQAEALAVFNSVRRWRPASLLPAAGGRRPGGP